jgi:hypothetical protein
MSADMRTHAKYLLLKEYQKFGWQSIQFDREVREKSLLSVVIVEESVAGGGGEGGGGGPTAKDAVPAGGMGRQKTKKRKRGEGSSGTVRESLQEAEFDFNGGDSEGFEMESEASEFVCANTLVMCVSELHTLFSHCLWCVCRFLLKGRGARTMILKQSRRRRLCWKS